MTQMLPLSALLIALAPFAQAHQYQPATAASKTNAAHVVQISCYRGPWVETIWDHPNGTFVPDLMAMGYSRVDATRIANSICEASELVGKPEAMKAALVRAIAETPPGS